MSEPNWRMLPPPGTGGGTFTMDGRTVVVAQNGYVDVPQHHAFHMQGWITCGQVGATASRPTNALGGNHYLDTTLGYVVINDGSGNWRNPSTGGIV